MEVHVEEVGSCKRKITVQVPAEDVKDKFNENYENLRKNLELPGFRRGHVPRRLMERRFGEDVAKEVRQTIVDESFEKAVKDNEIETVGPPDFGEEELPEAQIDQPYSYTVTVEVKPQFELPDYTKLELEKPPVEPTDEELQSRIDFYRHRMATVESVEDGAKEEDVITADVDFKEGDEVILRREDMNVSVKSGELSGVPIENLTEAITGAKKGDTKTFKTTLPDTFHLEEHRGKDVEIILDVKDVKRPELPEPTDEWAEDLGFDSMDELKEELKKQIKRMKDGQAKEQLRVQIGDQLAGMVEMDLPEDLMKRVTEDDLQRRRTMLQYQGLSEEEIEEKLAEEPESGESAAKNVKLYFIFDEIAKKETILVTEEEMHARVDQLAVNYGMDGNQLWEIMSAEGRLSSVRKELLDEKIVDFLIEKANVTEKAPEKTEEGKE